MLIAIRTGGKRTAWLLTASKNCEVLCSMARIPGADPFIPEHRDLPTLRSAIQRCRGCDLYRKREPGSLRRVRSFYVADSHPHAGGEQPGDREDIEGRPFVGPAGKLLDECLEAAGISRKEVYLTNAVKHFKWEPRGKRRLHKKPSITEVKACRPWLDAEIEAVRPTVIVCLGSTAARVAPWL